MVGENSVDTQAESRISAMLAVSLLKTRCQPTRRGKETWALGTPPPSDAGGHLPRVQDDSLARRASVMSRRQRELATWREAQFPKRDPDEFRRHILPLLQTVRPTDIAKGQGFLSLTRQRYAEAGSSLTPDTGQA
jgi:hypothetical protein